MPWNAIVIPWRVGQVPVPGSASWPANQAAWIYLKHQSVPYSIYFYLRLNAATVPPNSPQLTIFLKNFQDRGDYNLLKKVYMIALTGYILPFYSEARSDFLREVYNKITILRQPAIRAFRDSLITYFLRLHVGIDDYPDYVVEYFNTFTKIIGFGDPNRPGRNADYIYGNTVFPQVKAYFLKRHTAVMANEDKATLLYWWGIAGLPIDSLLIEGIHNIVAFLQYANTFYNVIADKIWAVEGRQTYGLAPGGIPGPGDVPTMPITPPTTPPGWYPRQVVPIWNGQPYYAAPNVLNPNYVGPIDFFLREQVDGTTEPNKLRIQYNLFNITSPNTNAFSAASNLPPGSPPVQSRHLWQPIAIANSALDPSIPIPPSPPATPAQVAQAIQLAKAVTFFKYDLGKYAAWGNDGLIQPFPTGFLAPNTVFDPSIYFTYSSVDNDPAFNDGTVLPLNATLTAPVDTIPVTSSPIYNPKGWGYRRCAGEPLNYYTGEGILDTFGQLNWVVDPIPGYPLSYPLNEFVPLGPYKAVPNNIRVKTLLNP